MFAPWRERELTAYAPLAVRKVAGAFGSATGLAREPASPPHRGNPPLIVYGERIKVDPDVTTPATAENEKAAESAVASQPDEAEGDVSPQPWRPPAPRSTHRT